AALADVPRRPDGEDVERLPEERHEPLPLGAPVEAPRAVGRALLRGGAGDLREEVPRVRQGLLPAPPPVSPRRALRARARRGAPREDDERDAAPHAQGVERRAPPGHPLPGRAVSAPEDEDEEPPEGSDVSEAEADEASDEAVMCAMH